MTPVRKTVAKNKKHYFVDLFAGCGGMSLGLEKAGFTPLLFSELNESAADTYKVNRADEYEFAWLKDMAKTSLTGPGRKKTPVVFEVGDVKALTGPVLRALGKKWKKSGMPVDLVCGGPPCQGYSKIGHKRTHKKYNKQKKLVPLNHLYKKMVSVIKRLQPKIFLFENVAGILSAKWSYDDNEIIFAKVFKAFSIEGYTVRWELVRAHEFGVPQNRPRVIMVGIKDQLLDKAQKGMADFDQAKGYPSPTARDCGFLPFEGSRKTPDLSKLLGDLMEEEYPSGFEDVKDCLDNTSNPRAYPKWGIKKMPIDLRKWFRPKDRDESKEVRDHQYSRHRDKTKKRFKAMIKDGIGHGTKKFSQRVLRAKWDKKHPKPMFTVTSLPDDHVHYSQPRILTVREWARLQTFPDWYRFCGPRTTGGRKRAGSPDEGNWDREVPHYTQIGNAVPVWLAEAVGDHFKKKFLG